MSMDHSGAADTFDQLGARTCGCASKLAHEGAGPRSTQRERLRWSSHGTRVTSVSCEWHGGGGGGEGEGGEGGEGRLRRADQGTTPMTDVAHGPYVQNRRGEEGVVRFGALEKARLRRGR